MHVYHIYLLSSLFTNSMIYFSAILDLFIYRLVFNLYFISEV